MQHRQLAKGITIKGGARALARGWGSVIRWLLDASRVQSYESGRLGGLPKKNYKLCVWAVVKMRESLSEVEQTDEDRNGIVQQILHHRSSRGAGRGHIVECVPSLPPIPDGRLHLVGLIQGTGRSSATGGVRHVVARTIGEI